MTGRSSAFGEDLFGSDAVDAVDGASTDQSPVVGDLVGGGAGTVAARRFDGRPVNVEGVTEDSAASLQDRSGDEPLNVDVPLVIGDGDGAGVLEPQRVHSVDDVDARQSRTVGDLRSGDGAGGEHDQGNGTEASHHRESIWTTIPPWSKWLTGALGLLAVVALAFATFQPVQVLPRIRLAPGFSFVDQAGAGFTSDDARGDVVLYGFAYGECGADCEPHLQTMAEVASRVEAETDLGDVDLRLVTVSFDPARDGSRLPELAAAAGADGERWRWVTETDEESLRTVLSSGFELFYTEIDGGSYRFDPRFVLVDGWGVIRGEYRYSTLAGDADKIIRHIGILGEELRNSKGAASIAYEAAHLFLCYP